MSQTIILMKLSQFLTICIEENEENITGEISKLKRLKAKKKIQLLMQQKKDLHHQNEIAIQLQQGHCFGFAVCHASMELIGKKDWWENLLIFIAKDNLTKLNLDSRVKIKGHRKKNYTRRQLFTRVLNYIFIYQSWPYFPSPFMLTGHNQLKLLIPIGHKIFFKEHVKEQSYFEVSHKNKILTIQNHFKMAGTFSCQDFTRILDKNLASHSIMLIHSKTHTIRLSYQFPSERWYLYDSENEHTSQSSMQQSYKRIGPLYSSIINNLGKTISIEVATLDSEVLIDKKPFEKLITEKVTSIVTAENFQFVIEETPDFIHDLLRDKKQINACRTILTTALPFKKELQRSGLEKLITVLPQTLPSVFALVDNSKEGLALNHALIFALKNTSDNGIQQIANKATPGIPALLRMIKKIKNDEVKLEYIKLIFEYHNHYTGIEAIAKHANQFLPHIFQLAIFIQSKENIILNYLTQCNLDNETGFQILLKICQDPMKKTMTNLIGRACTKATSHSVHQFINLPEHIKEPQIQDVIFYLNKRSSLSNTPSVVTGKRHYPFPEVVLSLNHKRHKKEKLSFSTLVNIKRYRFFNEAQPVDAKKNKEEEKVSSHPSTITRRENRS